MKMTKENFIHEFKKRLGERYALDVKDAAPIELYQTLVAVVKSGYSDIWRKTWKPRRGHRCGWGPRPCRPPLRRGPRPRG